MIWNRVKKWPDRVAMREKALGLWREISWRELGDKVRHVALALDSLGLGQGDVACILSNTIPEWMFADLGILGLGAVSAGIYPTDAASQVSYLVNDSGAKLIFVENEEQLDKALTARADCPSLQHIVIFDMEGLRDFHDPMAISFDELLTRGDARDRQHPDRWAELIRRAEPDDLAILVYTSGTTGPPKGAMISHHNIVFQCVNGSTVLPNELGQSRIAFLPLCHIAERIFTYQSLYNGAPPNFVENPETVPADMREVQPDFFLAVPRVWEKFYSGIRIALADATPLQRFAYERAIRVGYRIAEHKIAGTPVPTGLALKFKLAEALVLRNIRTMIGIDRAKWIATGAAPIAPDLIRWYLALGVDMLEVYGQTECTGLATTVTPDKIKTGTVGRSVPYAEVKISPEGEILLRGDHVFLGYYNQPEKTAETIRDGWLYTGDVGFIDNEGFVKITDRMKDIIITAGGKNITPSEIENELKFSPYIADAVVIGDGRKYLTALIMIDHENVEKYAQDRDVPFTNFTSLTRTPEVQELIAAEVEHANGKFARVETVKRFRLIEHQLDPEDEELTPTMKLKRSFVAAKYKDLIDQMYQAA